MIMKQATEQFAHTIDLSTFQNAKYNLSFNSLVRHDDEWWGERLGINLIHCYCLEKKTLTYIFLVVRNTFTN